MKKLVLSGLLITSSLSANAALVSVLNGKAIYDDVANLTWLKDANFVQTSGYATANVSGALNSSPSNIQADGRMGWQAANDWAAGLVVDGVSGWRLPSTIDVGDDGATFTNFFQGVDHGYNITVHSELSNLYFNELGNLSFRDINGNIQPNFGLQNTGSFSNIQSFYWSATEYAPVTSRAWVFRNDAGFQGDDVKNKSFHAWAVQSGNVSAASVPVPAAVWLFGSGLVGLLSLRRRRKT